MSDAPLNFAAVAKALGALAQPSRLAVFLEVMAAGPEGAPLQSLPAPLNTTGSALTLHLRALEAADLVEVRIRRRPKRSAVIVARVDRCAQLGLWLADHCRDAGWTVIEPGAAALETLSRSQAGRAASRTGV